MSRHLLLTFGPPVIIVGLLLYFGWIYFSAYAYVKQLPRKNMFLCDRHGAISPEYTISFQVGPKEDDVQKYCALCFHDKLKKAEQI